MRPASAVTVEVDAIELAQLRNAAAAWHVALRKRPAHDRLRPPVEYGSAEYHQLPADSPERVEAVFAAANRWAGLISSPHIGELLAEYVDWHQRRDMSESTACMAVLHDWRKVANSPNYRELERRRHTYTHPPLTADEIKARAREPWNDYEARQAA